MNGLADSVIMGWHAGRRLAANAGKGTLASRGERGKSQPTSGSPDGPSIAPGQPDTPRAALRARHSSYVCFEGKDAFVCNV
jgi:hypothetical protein